MSLIHESLYQSENLAEVNIPSYISMLTDNVLQTYAEDRSKIQISQKIEKISLDLNASIPLGLIVTELVTNSIHHAFTGSKKGKITITFSSEQNNFELSVRDNGKGIPSGFLVEESNSLGLKLVKMLTEQLNGNLELNTKGGTEYKIKFKI
ncbi:MAG: sensor histidine kinase [Candidatus Marinimicrobia bacterium]|nr:sensor histidine kinase [Candidatus Neomarinimicrobiota bacterium]